MDTLLIKEAVFNGRKYTPYQWQQKLELQNKSKKQAEPNLLCADGCKLCFRNGCTYTNKNDVPIVRRPHFAHINQDKTAQCLYIRKYEWRGGESDEHLNAKHMIATMNVSFKTVCCAPSCNRFESWTLPKDWTAKTEVRLNKKWLGDNVFFKPDGTIGAVIEVKHKHGCDGEKRKWLMEQSFEYIEVSTNDDPNLNIFTVIDSVGNFYCGTGVSGKEDTSYCHTEAARCNEIFIREMLKPISTGLSDLTEYWKIQMRGYYSNLNWDLYGYEPWDAQDSMDTWIEERPVLKAASEKALKEKRREKERREEQAKVERIQAQREKERREEQAKVERIQAQREWDQLKKEQKATERERRKEKGDLISEWKHSELNKSLLRQYPEESYPVGKWKGCHLLIIVYAYPHQINWVNGFVMKGRNCYNFHEKYKTIADACYNMTGGFELWCQDLEIVKMQTNVTIEKMMECIQVRLKSLPSRYRAWRLMTPHGYIVKNQNGSFRAESSGRYGQYQSFKSIDICKEYLESRQ